MLCSFIPYLTFWSYLGFPTFNNVADVLDAMWRYWGFLGPVGIIALVASLLGFTSARVFKEWQVKADFLRLNIPLKRCTCTFLWELGHACSGPYPMFGFFILCC